MSLQRSLYKTGKVTSQVRLLQGKTVLQDDSKLSEYNIEDGAVISALFEPDVDVNIEVSTGHQTYHLVLPNSTSVMALKLQLCDLIKWGIAAEEIDLLSEDIQLENDLPIHYYGIKSGSKLTILRPYISVTIEDNHGDVLYRRISRRETIREIKSQLRKSQRVDPESGRSTNYRGHENDMRLYLVEGENEFRELADNLTINDHKIQDNASLYLLSYRWTNSTRAKDVPISTLNSGSKLHGVEYHDTVLSVRVRAQDQLGIPVKDVKVVSMKTLEDCDEIKSGSDICVATEDDVKAAKRFKIRKFIRIRHPYRNNNLE